MAKKRKFIVLPRNGKIFEEGLTTGKGHRKFNKAGAMWISDEAEAREIDHEYGMKGKKKVAVTTDQQYEWSVNNENGDGTKMDNIHNYTFGPMTSKAAEDFWRRYKRKKAKKQKRSGGTEVKKHV